jgi:addiction module HigA family antidote
MGDWAEEIEREERVGFPIHPGEILREEWLGPLGMNANQLSRVLGVDRQNVYEIVNEKRGLSAEMALRLSRWSGMNERFWIGLQSRYDVETAKMKHGGEIEREVQPREVALGR